MAAIRLLRFFIIGLMLPAGFASLPAQNSPVAFRRLTTEQGLAQDFVTSIAQDKFGFLWFGTQDGLTRFDGRQCLTFRHRTGDSLSLPNNRISGLTMDAAGKLWISTYKGICYLQPETRRIRRLHIPPPGHPDYPQERYFSNIAFDKKGTAWAVTDSFLMRLNPNTLQAEYFKIPCNVKQETQVYADSKGRIWVTFLGKHLLKFDVKSEQFTYLRGVDKPNGAPRPWPMWIQEDSKGTIWNADWDRAFYTYDEQLQQLIDWPDEAGIATVFIIDERAGAAPVIWAGGGDHGLWRMDISTKQRTQFPSNQRDPYTHNNARAHALHLDPTTGILWIGTEFGVEYYDPNGICFERVLLPERPGQNQFFTVSGLQPDPDDTDLYWVGVWGVGLFEWRRSTGTFKLYEQKHNRLHSNEIFDIVRDRQGNLWLATLQGVERFDPRTRQRRHFMQPPPWNTPGDKALCVDIGPDGRIWSGNNRGGLVETNPLTGMSRNIRLLRHDGHERSNHLTWDIRVDHKGRILAGSPDGLFRYDPTTQTNDHILYRTPPLPVTDAVADTNGTLYVGTEEGLYVLNERDSLLFVLNREKGLFNEVIRKIELDPTGNIWVATANGLHRYTPKTGRIEYFSKADGLFVTDHQVGLRVTAGGELFISGEYSFNIGSPDMLGKQSRPPRLAPDGISAPARLSDWAPGQPLVLQPGETAISFEVAIIHFNQADKTTLSYRLAGFESDWRETNERTITYTNLDGGRYTLQVRAHNNDGVWSEETLEIPFRVKPVFYKTPWFAVLLGLLMTGIFSGIALYRRTVRRRMEKMRTHALELEKRQLLNEIALLKTQVNPHFLFNSLSILSSLVHTDANLSEKFIDQLSRSYRYILEQKDQSLVTLRTELEFIKAYAFLLKIRFEDKFDLRVQLDETLLDHYKIAPLTMQLLIENAVKHNRMSAKEPLIVEVLAERDTLIVRNPLRPRPSPESSTGTGLKNIISRYALLTERPVWAGEVEDGYFVVRAPLL
jgi:ligand-binding sensor domain-containing protein